MLALCLICIEMMCDLNLGHDTGEKKTIELNAMDQVMNGLW